MIYIKNGEIIRDDKNEIIKGLEDLKERLQEHKGKTIHMNFSIFLKGYYEIMVEEDFIKIGYYKHTIIRERELKDFLRKNGFKSSKFGSTF